LLNSGKSLEPYQYMEDTMNYFESIKEVIKKNADVNSCLSSCYHGLYGTAFNSVTIIACPEYHGKDFLNLKISGKLPYKDGDSSVDSSWSYLFFIHPDDPTLVSPDKVYVTGIEFSEHHLFLEMSDETTTVFNQYGIVGKTFRVEEEKKTPKTEVNNLISKVNEIKNLCDEIISESTQLTTKKDSNLVWVEKDGQRYKASKSDLDDYFRMGYKLSPHKKAKKN